MKALMRHLAVNLPGPSEQAVRGFAGVCYTSRRWPMPLPENRLVLPAQTAQGLADLLPLILCGEESAELAFADVVPKLPADFDPALRQALAEVAADERRHAALLLPLRDGLPPPSSPSPARRAVRFMREMADADPATHLARIAALDAGTCHVLAEVFHADRPLAAHAGLAGIFNGIRRDEGRHVRVSRRCAAALGLPAVVERSKRREVLNSFAGLMAHGAGALAALGVNAQQLLARLRRA